MLFLALLFISVHQWSHVGLETSLQESFKKIIDSVYLRDINLFRFFFLLILVLVSFFLGIFPFHLKFQINWHKVAHISSYYLFNIYSSCGVHYFFIPSVGHLLICIVPFSWQVLLEVNVFLLVFSKNYLLFCYSPFVN